MNPIRRYERSLIVTITLLLLVLSTPAQIGNLGTLDDWTTKPVSREHSANGEVTYVKVVRADKRMKYDRVVFEFTGPMPNYRVEYLKSRFYDAEAGRVRIKSAGNAFIQVEMFTIPTSEEQLKFTEAKGFRPKGRLRLPTVKSVTDQGLFEGFYDFVIGVSSRKKGFRISEFSNPSRLVVDIEH